MFAELFSLILSREWIAADDSPDGRLVVKVLAASVLRNLPGAELKVVRAVAVAEDWKPLFRVERAGLEERGSGRETSRGPWQAVACVDEVEQYPWVFFLDSGSLLLRGMDHLWRTSFICMAVKRRPPRSMGWALASRASSKSPVRVVPASLTLSISRFSASSMEVPAGTVTETMVWKVVLPSGLRRISIRQALCLRSGIL